MIFDVGDDVVQVLLGGVQLDEGRCNESCCRFEYVQRRGTLRHHLFKGVEYAVGG